MEADTFKVMKRAKELLPEDKLLDLWDACEEMLASNHLKYKSCEHVKEALLDSASVIVEATGDPFWGSGLNVQQTKECLPNYWPGENHMGQLLMHLWDELHGGLELDGLKRKAASPLSNEPKQL